MGQSVAYICVVLFHAKMSCIYLTNQHCSCSKNGAASILLWTDLSFIYRIYGHYNKCEFNKIMRVTKLYHTAHTLGTDTKIHTVSIYSYIHKRTSISAACLISSLCFERVTNAMGLESVIKVERETGGGARQSGSERSGAKLMKSRWRTQTVTEWKYS